MSQLPRHAVLPLPHLHTATLAVALRGGSRYEEREEAGLTHFLEHMLFRGAGERAGLPELMEAFERVGGEPEAYTSEDAITLVLELDPARLREGAELLADVLLRPSFTEIEAERALILEERLERVDAEGHPADLEDLAMGLAFAGHPLSRSILGRKSTIQSVTPADLHRWRERLVQRENVALAVAGPIEAAEAAAQLAPLAGLPAGDALPLQPPLPPASGPRTTFHRAEGPQTELRFCFRAPGERDPAFPALCVLVDLLDGGPTSRLPRELVDAGLAYNARAELVALPDGGLVALELAVAHRKVGEALETLRSLLAGLTEGVEGPELERAALRRAHRERLERDDARNQAEWAARRLLYDLDPDPATARAAEGVVSAEAIAELAATVFAPQNLSVAGICSRPATRRAVKSALANW